MKKSTNFLLMCLLAFLLPNITNGQNVSEGFETNSCSNASQAFYIGCFPDWINVSGSADVSSNQSGVSPYSGSRYVHMYSNYEGFNCSSTPRRAESIALNYNFQAGQTYTINYALRWLEVSSCHTLETKWVLTNNRANQIGGTNGCETGEILPTISSSDQVVRTHNISGNQTSWITYSQTFTPSSNFNQLWIRPETKLRFGCSSSSQATSRVYLDAFELETCVSTGLSTNFTLWAGSNKFGNVTVNTEANPNPVFVNHWWDVYYAPNGNTSGNSPVPGNPTQCCSSITSSFSNNLYINNWYYIKHGIWNECTSWRETRKRFRVQIGGINAGQQEYSIEIEDVDFEPTESYLSSMNEMVSNLSSEEIKLHHQEELLFFAQTPSRTISNHPNPFNTTTTIAFSLEQEQPVSLYVHDFTGRLIRVLLENERTSMGRNQIDFDGSNLANGIYFYTLESNGFKETKKMILSK